MRGNTCGLGSTPAVRGCGTSGAAWAEWEAAGALSVRLSLVSIVPASDTWRPAAPEGCQAQSRRCVGETILRVVLSHYDAGDFHH